jgi:hypothetical protein
MYFIRDQRHSDNIYKAVPLLVMVIRLVMDNGDQNMKRQTVNLFLLK